MWPLLAMFLASSTLTAIASSTSSSTLLSTLSSELRRSGESSWISPRSGADQVPRLVHLVDIGPCEANSYALYEQVLL